MFIDFQRAIVYVWQAVGLVWLVSLFFTKRTAQAQTSGFRILQMSLLGLAVALMAETSLRIGWLGLRFLPEAKPLEAIGFALTVAGCLFAIWARVLLGANWSGGATIKQGHELIVAGPYAVARHPIYSGLLLAALGTGIAIGEYRCILAIGLLFIGFEVKIAQEERMMLRAFPDAYPSYRKRVRSLIPGVF